MANEEDDCGNIRFHSICGSNIILSKNNTVAYRKASFAHGLTFTENPIKPEEIFLLEIGKTESGWSGHMRMGFSEVDPSFYLGGSQLPPYALPDLTTLGRNTPRIGSSWIFPIASISPIQPTSKRMEFMNDQYIKTKRGTIRRSVLRSCESNGMHDRNEKLPTDTGSRIGVVYFPRNPKEAELYFLVNGVEVGPCVLDLPYHSTGLRAVVDVYGTTKEVRIVQLYTVKSLQATCLDTIMSIITKSDVGKLPLPNKLQEFLINEC